MSAENPKERNKKKINQIKQKKIDGVLPEANLNAKKSTCELNIKTKRQNIRKSQRKQS